MFEEDTTPPPAPKPGVGRTAIIVLSLALVAIAGGGAYWVSQLNQNLTQQVTALQAQTKTQADDLHVLQDRLHISADELDRLASTTTAVQSTVSQTRAQLANTQQATQSLAQQQAAAETEIASVKQDTGTQIGAINGSLTGVKSNVATNTQQITATQKELEETKAQLKSAVGDLGVQSGLIATTRNQLDVLEKMGQRAYFEFHLGKTKQPQRLGAIELQVKKVDLKHERYTVDIYADDIKVEKKDRNVNEPVQFLVGSNHTLNELVVYSMDKNTITGYLSAPKFPDAATATPAPSKRS